MAIYDVDAINEQELAASRDNILDNMLEACDQMLNALDESKARYRTVEALNNKRNQYKKNSETYEELYDAARKVGNAKLAEKYASKKQDNDTKSSEIYDKLHMIDDGYYKDGVEYRKMAEEKFKKMYNATPAKERKPGFYKDLYEKKKAIKETCLTILSVLDEI